MQRFLLRAILLLTLGTAAAAQPGGSSPAADFEQIGQSGAEPTTVLFRPLPLVEDIYFWQWDFGNTDVRSGSELVDVTTTYDESREYVAELTVYSISAGVSSIEKPVFLKADDLVIRDDFQDQEFTTWNWMRGIPEACQPDFHPVAGSQTLRFFQNGGGCEGRQQGEVNGDIICLGPAGPGFEDGLRAQETAAFVAAAVRLDELRLPSFGRFDLLALEADSPVCGADPVVARVEIERRPEGYSLRLAARETIPGPPGCAQRYSEPYDLGREPGLLRLEVEWRPALHGDAVGHLRSWVSTPVVEASPSEPSLALDGLNNADMSYSLLHLGLRHLTLGEGTYLPGYLEIDRVEVRRYSATGPLL